jgi:hypothetical protein
MAALRKLSPERRAEVLFWKHVQRLAADKAVARRLHVSRATIARVWAEELHSLRQIDSMAQLLSWLNRTEPGQR